MWKVFRCNSDIINVSHTVGIRNLTVKEMERIGILTVKEVGRIGNLTVKVVLFGQLMSMVTCFLTHVLFSIQ